MTWVEGAAVTAMGISLIVLSHVLGKRRVLSFPAAVALSFSGLLAIAWQLPALMAVSSELRLYVEVAEIQFFAAISISMTLFALDAFIGQARTLARAEEILARQSAELEHAAVARELAAIVKSSEDAIISQTVDGVILSWNPGAERMFGYSLDEARGESIAILVPPEHEEEMADLLTRAGRGEAMNNFETIQLKKDGTRINVSLSASPMRDDEGNVIGVSTITRDVTERRRAEELRKLALLDELTGLNNRRGFMLLAGHQIQVSKRDRKPFTLLFIDLNNLKKINDNFGHKEGDAAIADAARILKETFRESDIVARVGGDEFCVLMTSDNQLDTATPIARLQTILELHNAGLQRPYKVSLSVGVAHYDPEEPSSIEELMERADLAMYEQKLARTSRVLVGAVEPEFRSLTETMSENDFEIITANSGQEVIRRATLERPDLILLDYKLNDMNGVDVARRLRQAPSTSLIPIIMVSGANDATNEVESLRAGVDDYIRKPFTKEALRVRVDNLLKRAVRR